MEKDVSILICSYAGSKYLSSTLMSIILTLKDFPYYLFLDREAESSGLENTPNRYQALFEKTTSRYIVKSDDDVLYFPGWLEECIQLLEEHEDIAYVCPMSHKLLPSLYTDRPIYNGGGFTYQSHIGGLCWVFRRELWYKVPYTTVAGIRNIDSKYGAVVYTHTGQHAAYLNNILCSHLGQDRRGGIDL